ncbi:MAG TPA: DUF1697 domain-containing protein [Polyangiaceae bacterium]
MKRYVAFLRGVSPLNAKMPELKRAFELAGFSEVKTVLGSGNVVFNAKPAGEASLARQAEAAMTKHLGRSFFTLVRSVDDLVALLESDPYRGSKLAPGSKRVITFLPEKPGKVPKLPIELDGARILALRGSAVLSAYVVSPKGPVFMVLLEKTFGKNITTRTWDTVVKVTK